MLKANLDAIRSTSSIDPRRNSNTVPMIKIKAKKYGEKILVGSIILPYDPTTLDIKYKVETKTCDFINQKQAILCKDTIPEKLTIDFLLDDTTFSNLALYTTPRDMITDSVDNKIQLFRKLCYEPDKKTHLANYLSLKALSMRLSSESSRVFTGILNDMTIKTELVDATGANVKAKIHCTFIYQKQ